MPSSTSACTPHLTLLGAPAQAQLLVSCCLGTGMRGGQPAPAAAERYHPKSRATSLWRAYTPRTKTRTKSYERLHSVQVGGPRALKAAQGGREALAAEFQHVRMAGNRVPGDDKRQNEARQASQCAAPAPQRCWGVRQTVTSNQREQRGRGCQKARPQVQQWSGAERSSLVHRRYRGQGAVQWRHEWGWAQHAVLGEGVGCLLKECSGQGHAFLARGGRWWQEGVG